MSEKQHTKWMTFKPFMPCPDCGAPQVQFCPWCGRDLFPISHGCTTYRVGDAVYKMMSCTPCIERMMAGEKPPFVPVAKLN